MIIHEIRNRTTVIGRFLSDVEGRIADADDEALQTRWERARGSVASLEKLADRFAPLASRSYRRGKRTSLVDESIERSLALVSGEIASLGVTVKVPKAHRVRVAVDPGELDAIVVNLLTNALYWLAKEEERVIKITARRIQQGARIRIGVHDNGPGVDESDAERVFWPGVTRKPGGIGMGLTVASELVAEHGGQMSLTYSGQLGGASFVFDLPIARRDRSARRSA